MDEPASVSVDTLSDATEAGPAAVKEEAEEEELPEAAETAFPGAPLTLHSPEGARSPQWTVTEPPSP
jgi:hypothetical protein